MRQIPLRPVLIGLVVFVAAVGLIRVVPSQGSPASSNSASSGGSQNGDSKGQPNGQCTVSSPGVTLVVDFGDASGRAPLVRCAKGFNGGVNADTKMSGWQIFAATGIEVAGTTEFPVGFVCRIAGFPAEADQPCTSTPTYAQGHWAYFYAQSSAEKSGGQATGATAGTSSGATQAASKWVLSGAGASMRKPPCGSAEGWLFVKGDSTTATSSAQQPAIEPQVFSCAP